MLRSQPTTTAGRDRGLRRLRHARALLAGGATTLLLGFSAFAARGFSGGTTSAATPTSHGSTHRADDAAGGSLAAVTPASKAPSSSGSASVPTTVSGGS